MKYVVGAFGAVAVAALVAVCIAQETPAQEARPERRIRREEGRPADAERRPDMLMVMFDKDRDGSLSKEEIDDAANVLRALDRDEDGIVTAEEARPRRERRGAGGPGGDGEERPGAGFGGRGGFVMRFDTDKDGFVTRDEYVSGAEEQFNRFDGDHDGKIDADEAAAATPMMGGGRPPQGERPRRARDTERP